MKLTQTIYIILLCMLFSGKSWSQELRLDTICRYHLLKERYSERRPDKASYSEYEMFSNNVEYKVDESKPTRTSYTFRTSESIKNGWYLFFAGYKAGSYNPTRFVFDGIIVAKDNNYDEPIDFDLIRWYNTLGSIFIEGCFQNDIPCCTWQYSQPYCKQGVDNELIYKQVSFTDGLLDGNYIIYKQDSTILYQTTFRNGTGYFKEYDCEGEVACEGEVRDGYMEGKWVFYMVTDNSHLRRGRRIDGILIADFNKGILKSKESFFPKEDIKELTNRSTLN